MNKEMIKRKLRREAGLTEVAIDYSSTDSSYDSEVEREKRKKAVNIFQRDASMSSLSKNTDSQSSSLVKDDLARVQKRTVMFDLPTQSSVDEQV